MPQYLTHKKNTYYFRQGVPEELRVIIGRREIKRSLGRDYNKAVSECKRYAVVADGLIADARAKLDGMLIEPYSTEGIRRTKHLLLLRLTPELETEFGNLMRASLLDTDKNTRVSGMTDDEFDEYGKFIEDSLVALRDQLRRGKVEPMLESSRLFLVGRGYDPRFTEEEWRRVAYVMTEATLEAYEGMAARQRGMVVKAATDTLLASQFEVQNPPKSPSDKPVITWRELYDVWADEFVRPQRTKDAYLAALMKFMELHPDATPLTATRDHALKYRDYWKKLGKAPGTVANKIGFIGTIFNSGLDSTKFAKHLPPNPFADIKVKTPKKGLADTKRRPFRDDELKAIFGSPVYTAGFRPRGGGGEAAAWIPAIAYLTGARLEEIAVLKTSQFHVDAQGNHYFHVEDAKNENSADRDVPIHAALIEAGLLDYVKSCSGRLFPKVKCTSEVQSKAYSQWYGRYLDKLGITAKSKVFHSFRHLFKDMCRNAGLDDSAIDQICGHEPGTVAGKYGDGRRIDVLAGLMNKVVPPVSVPKIPVPKLKSKLPG